MHDVHNHEYVHDETDKSIRFLGTALHAAFFFGSLIHLFKLRFFTVPSNF